MSTTVSVICLAYNHEKYIRKTLEGFVMQKTNFSVEYIIHDDASTDSTIRTAFVGKRNVYRAFILTEFRIATKDGVCLHLIELCRYR